MYSKSGPYDERSSKCPTLHLSAAAIILGWLFVGGLSSDATSKDFSPLVRIAYAAFLADQGSAVCASQRLDFPAEDVSAFRQAKLYAELIKKQVSSGLSEEETRSILTEAAKRAQDEAREAIQMLKSEIQFRRWCSDTVVPLVQQVVGEYVSNKATIDRIIEKAKTSRL